jgi:hypothetical protein
MAIEPGERGVGKCAKNHAGSFGYPTRPPEAYGCGAAMPDDATELDAARFCRDCGAPYFENGSG